MEEIVKSEDLEEQDIGPYQVSREDMTKMLIKAYNITKEPRDYYPTVDEIDDLLESEPFQRSMWVREDAFKLFVMCIVWGFTRDKAWHAANPGFKKATSETLYKYVTTPYTGEDAYTCHVGVWNEDDSDELKEDRQSAFEYMQSIILDESIYQIVDEKKAATA